MSSAARDESSEEHEGPLDLLLTTELYIETGL